MASTNREYYLFISLYLYNVQHLPINGFQHQTVLKSLVYQLPKDNALYDLSRRDIDTPISHQMNSADGIKVSIDKPLNNSECLNIYRPAVLR